METLIILMLGIIFQRSPPGGKRIMESKLMDQWTNAFAKDFYRQLKDQKKSCNEAAINNSNNNHRVICLTTIIL